MAAAQGAAVIKQEKGNALATDGASAAAKKAGTPEIPPKEAHRMSAFRKIFPAMPAEIKRWKEVMALSDNIRCAIALAVRNIVAYSKHSGVLYSAIFADFFGLNEDEIKNTRIFFPNFPGIKVINEDVEEQGIAPGSPAWAALGIHQGSMWIAANQVEMVSDNVTTNQPSPVNDSVAVPADAAQAVVITTIPDGGAGEPVLPGTQQPPPEPSGWIVSTKKAGRGSRQSTTGGRGRGSRGGRSGQGPDQAIQGRSGGGRGRGEEKAGGRQGRPKQKPPPGHVNNMFRSLNLE
jgi:hypothetical protein